MTEGSQAAQSEDVYNLVVEPATLSLAVLDESFYTPASSPTCLNSTATVQSAESNAKIMPPPAAENKKKAKKPRVPHVEPVEEVEDFCVPAWFLEFMTALETPKEALEVDDQMTDPSHGPLLSPATIRARKMMMTRLEPKA